MIHTFGDSHCGHMDGVGWHSIDGVLCHWIGPKTCSGFGFQKLGMLNISDFGVVDGDVVVFSFGEVDCRAHIPKYMNDYKGMINRIVDNYFYAMMLNVEQFEGLTVFVMCVPPVARRNEINDNPEFPTVGSDEERKTCVEYMNDRIKMLCERAGYTFFDVYKEYCDSEGYLNVRLSDGNVHIKDAKYIKEKLYDKIS